MQRLYTPKNCSLEKFLPSWRTYKSTHASLQHANQITAKWSFIRQAKELPLFNKELERIVSAESVAEIYPSLLERFLFASAGA